MKNILVPYDFSDYARAAAATGAWLARKTGAHLHLLHVVYAPPEWNRMPVEQQQNYPEVEARMVDADIKLDKLANSAPFKGVTVHTHVYSGYPREQIVQFAHSYQMNLIVMGVHGAGESQNLFVGSTAQQVIRTAKCPVLSVKKNYKPGAIKKIVFASDFENPHGAVNQLKNVAAKLGAAIELLFVNTPLNFYDTPSAEEKLKAAVPVQQQVKFTTHIYNDLTIEQGILNFARRTGADWIAMMAHSRRHKPYYYLGNTETVLYHAEIPVLSFRLPETE
jgi:nucleotide-binding universal stress UspA family protein